MCITFVFIGLFTLLSQFVHTSCFTIISSSHRVGPIHQGQRNGFVRIYMSGDAQSEAQRLMDQAKKLREEVDSMSAVEPANKMTPEKSKVLYDDEVEPMKDPLSKEMRNRLMREASTGLDSDRKQVNVILYISVGVALLVLIGGQGIFF